MGCNRFFKASLSDFLVVLGLWYSRNIAHLPWDFKSKLHVFWFFVYLEHWVKTILAYLTCTCCFATKNHQAFRVIHRNLRGQKIPPKEMTPALWREYKLKRLENLYPFTILLQSSPQGAEMSRTLQNFAQAEHLPETTVWRMSNRRNKSEIRHWKTTTEDVGGGFQYFSTCSNSTPTWGKWIQFD